MFLMGFHGMSGFGLQLVSELKTLKHLVSFSFNSYFFSLMDNLIDYSSAVYFYLKLYQK